MHMCTYTEIINKKICRKKSTDRSRKVYKTSIKNTLNLLNLYKESGVDELISSRPKNRTIRKKDYVSKKMQKSDEMNSAKVSEENISSIDDSKNYIFILCKFEYEIYTYFDSVLSLL